jgi:hypothetical protein
MVGKRQSMSPLQRRTVDEAVVSYVEWRECCTAVWDAYRRWVSSPVSDAALWHRAYAAALDREEAAAQAYGQLMAFVGHLVETGLDYELPQAA